jgi:hypothetical protein
MHFPRDSQTEYTSHHTVSSLHISQIFSNFFKSLSLCSFIRKHQRLASSSLHFIASSPIVQTFEYLRLLLIILINLLCCLCRYKVFFLDFGSSFVVISSLFVYFLLDLTLTENRFTKFTQLPLFNP